MDATALKRMAAEAALQHVVKDAVLGVGTGSTTNHFIDLVAERLPGRVAGGVASSKASAARLRRHRIPVIELDQLTDTIPVYVDGADEFDPELHLTKGGGGALTREKIVAAASTTFVCIVDDSKQVPILGGFPLPIEVIAMAVPLLRRKIQQLGGLATVRQGFVTDNGNPILDVSGLTIRDPEGLELELDSFPGVVTSGLFARRAADIVLMASAGGVRRFDRPPAESGATRHGRL